jgi:hypothetical protein
VCACASSAMAARRGPVSGAGSGIGVSDGSGICRLDWSLKLSIVLDNFERHFNDALMTNDLRREKR